MIYPRDEFYIALVLIIQSNYCWEKSTTEDFQTDTIENTGFCKVKDSKVAFRLDFSLVKTER